MRQPQAKNCSSVSQRESTRNTPPEKKNPIGAPSWGNMPYQARLPGGAFSMARSTAPPHSPPRPRPWPKRQSGEQQRSQDADGVVGRQRADGDRGHAHGEQGGDQRGLAAHAIAEMAEERGSDRAGQERDSERRERGQCGRRRIRRRKEQARKHEHGRRRVDVEIEELDRRADQAGKEHLVRSVDGRPIFRACLAHRRLGLGLLVP